MKTERMTSPKPWGILVALMLAVLGAGLSGCAREDYHCDATGCYYCDGVGCRPVTPPNRTTCRGDFQCSTGQVCTDRGCASTCNRDADCQRGWICRGGSGADAGTATGLCVAPTETATRTPGACTTNAECGDVSGVACINGMCSRTTTAICTSSTQCTGGQTCVGGRCTAPADTCQFNNQCGANRVCVNNACRAACGVAGATCPTGQECAAGVCQDRNDRCTSDATCATGQRCLNGTCLQSCTPGSNTCGSTDLFCSDEGLCLPDTRPRPFCDATHPCQTGSECVGGVCRVPCTDSVVCARTDVSYRNCGPVANATTGRNYCLTDREYRPVCAHQTDCSAGQSCVDGACQ